MKSKKWFNAITTKAVVGDGTAGDLLIWLEQYVNLLFPENGIEWWSDNRYSERGIKSFTQFPSGLKDCRDMYHFACYVHRGSCEGAIVEVLAVFREGGYRNLTSIKSFGSDEENWQIAAALNSVLDSLYGYEELPSIVSFSQKLPRKYASSRETSLTETVTVERCNNKISVTTAGGVILDQHDMTDKGVNAKFHIDPIQKDWITVLTNMRANFVVNDLREVEAIAQPA